MGTFEVRVEMAGPARDNFEPVEVLVDTGSTYTVLPRPMLEGLGVEPHHRARFRLADGSRIELEVGRVWIRFQGREEQTLVVFGEHALLGAVTLEQFLLVADPIERRLVPVDGLLMRLAA